MLKGGKCFFTCFYKFVAYSEHIFVVILHLLGLEEVEAECQKLQIEFHLLKGDSQTCVPNLIKKLKLDAVVADFSPLRVPLSWIDDVKESIPEDVPLCQVDFCVICL